MSVLVVSFYYDIIITTGIVGHRKFWWGSDQFARYPVMVTRTA